MSNQDRLDSLKQKYQSVLEAVRQHQVRLEHLHVQDNKLFMSGVAPSADAKNKVWDAIKRVDPSYSDLTADLRVEESAPAQTAGAAAGGGQQEHQTYTVKAGDTLSRISLQFYGDASQYMRIYNANRSILTDPNKIQVGQTLTIPPKS